jgi:hypothetical protein
VVHRSKVKERVAGQHRGDAERAALAGINVELSDEFTRSSEFHDFAGVGRTAVDGVAIGGKQGANANPKGRGGLDPAKIGVPLTTGDTALPACGTAKIASSAGDAT